MLEINYAESGVTRLHVTVESDHVVNGYSIPRDPFLWYRYCYLSVSWIEDEFLTIIRSLSI